MEESTQEQIIEFLTDLTKRRRAGIRDSLFDSIMEEMDPSRPKKITWEQMHKREKEVEELLPKWWVIWDKVNQSYGIIPREVQ